MWPAEHARGLSEAEMCAIVICSHDYFKHGADMLTSRFPGPVAFPSMDVGVQVAVGRLPVEVQVDVGPTPIPENVAIGSLFHAHVMDVRGCNDKVCDQHVHGMCQADGMMPMVPFVIRWAI